MLVLPPAIQAVDEADRGGTRFVVELFQLGPERFDLAVVGDDVEQVAFAQVVEHELGRALGLLDLLAAHAAGAVDDEHDGLRRLFRRRRLSLRGWRAAGSSRLHPLSAGS